MVTNTLTHRQSGGRPALGEICGCDVSVTFKGPLPKSVAICDNAQVLPAVLASPFFVPADAATGRNPRIPEYHALLRFRLSIKTLRRFEPAESVCLCYGSVRTFGKRAGFRAVSWIGSAVEGQFEAVPKTGPATET